MAKVTIEITDKEDGEIGIELDFDPPISGDFLNDSQLPLSQYIGAMFAKSLHDGTFEELIESK